MHRARHRLVVPALLVGLAVAGCGTSQTSETIKAATGRGLSYSLLLAVKGDQYCATTSVHSVRADGRAVLQGSHLCGSPATLGRPVLIQAKASKEAMLTDVTAGSCSVVRGGRRGMLAPLASRCTSTQPRFRVTILPAVGRLALSGIVGIPVINFPRHRCALDICITPLVLTPAASPAR